MNGLRDIVIFSTADWNHPFWTNKQHMAMHFARRGYRVLYVESLGLRKPTMGGRDLRRIFGRLGRFFRGTRQVHERIWVFSPLVLPYHGGVLVRLLNSLLLAGSLRWLLWRLRFKKFAVWTYNPMVWSLAQGLNPDLFVYHSVDDLRAAPRLPTAEISLAENQILRRAQYVFVTSPTLHQRYFWMGRPDSVYLPNVADYEHFCRARDGASERAPVDIREIKGPRIGFIGAISAYKFDIPLVASLARLRPKMQFVLIGQVGEGDPSTDVSELVQPNVHILGPRRYEALPDYLAHMDVVILPSPQNEYTKSMFPMKFFEYLAAGKTVIASPLPSLASFGSLYRSATTAEDFAREIDRALAGERVSLELIDRFAQENTWERRLDSMIQVVEGAGVLR